jgi:GT2 family glycosyltransferase
MPPDSLPEAGPLRDLAVVIVNHNTSQLLAACLSSLEAGGLEGVDAAIWVVDNASTDDSVQMLRHQFPSVHLIASPDNLGFSAANNLALRALGMDGPAPACRHALILNPDTLVPAGAVAGLLAELAASPDIGVVGPKLILPDGSLDRACRRAFPTPEVSFYRFSGLSRLFPRHPRFGRYNMSHLDPDEPADIDAVVGACMLLRGEALAQVGLLDERFWMYGEDLDWCLRFHQAGWRVVYRPGVTVHHVKRAASRASRRARFEFQRAMWLFYAKHYARQTNLPLHLLVVLGLSLRGGPRLLREILTDRAAWGRKA